MKSIHDPAYGTLLAWLKNSRKAAKLSMRDVGQRLGVSHTWINKIEMGERRLDILEYVRLCHALGVKTTAGISIVESNLPALYRPSAELPMDKAAEPKPYPTARRHKK